MAQRCEILKVILMNSHLQVSLHVFKCGVGLEQRGVRVMPTLQCCIYPRDFHIVYMRSRNAPKEECEFLQAGKLNKV